MSNKPNPFDEELNQQFDQALKALDDEKNSIDQNAKKRSHHSTEEEVWKQQHPDNGTVEVNTIRFSDYDDHPDSETPPNRQRAKPKKKKSRKKRNILIIVIVIVVILAGASLFMLNKLNMIGSDGNGFGNGWIKDNDIDASDIDSIMDADSLNAWPSWQMQVYDGWILRYSCFYTHRTNCVEQIGVSCLPMDTKVKYCEDIYRRWHTPCIFKISPVGDPDIDAYLAKRGYGIQHHTTVMTRSLAGISPGDGPAGSPPGTQLIMRGRVDYAWLEGLFSLKQMTDMTFLRIVPAMYDAIPKDEIAVSLWKGGRVIATGLGILDRDYVGVYAIHVSPENRRMGYASAIVSAILTEGKRRGAGHAYLQVVTDNAPAKALYRSLGFTRSYSYYFRVREV